MSQTSDGDAAKAAADKLVKAALSFDAWVRANVGNTADYPAHFLCTNVGAADALSCLLSEFNKACDCYRIVSAAEQARRRK